MCVCIYLNNITDFQTNLLIQRVLYNIALSVNILLNFIESINYKKPLGMGLYKTT